MAINNENLASLYNTGQCGGWFYIVDTVIYYHVIVQGGDNMVKHTIEISDNANLRIKVLKAQYGLNTVSEVLEKVLSEIQVVI